MSNTPTPHFILGSDNADVKPVGEETPSTPTIALPPATVRLYPIDAVQQLSPPPFVMIGGGSPEQRYRKWLEKVVKDFLASPIAFFEEQDKNKNHLRFHALYHLCRLAGVAKKIHGVQFTTPEMNKRCKFDVGLNISQVVQENITTLSSMESYLKEYMKTFKEHGRVILESKDIH